MCVIKEGNTHAAQTNVLSYNVCLYFPIMCAYYLLHSSYAFRLYYLAIFRELISIFLNYVRKYNKIWVKQ